MKPYHLHMPRIVLVGEPGSGKSTVANELARLTGATVIEASTAVIYPIAAIAGKLPKEETLLERFASGSKTRSAHLTREQARATFERISKTYSPDFIARALHARYVEPSREKTVIFSGLRGFDNAAYCRLHNDFVVYLDANETELIERLKRDRGYDERQAKIELRMERILYRTRQIKTVADLVIDTNGRTVTRTAKEIAKAVTERFRMCVRCVNTARNPAMTFDKNGHCQICATYLKHFDKKRLAEELRFLNTFKSAKNDACSGRYDIMVGISGGKDSTATLATIKKMGFRPLAFTFDLGYLPATTIPRAKATAKRLGVDHETIDVRPYIRDIDRRSYIKTVALYEQPFTLATKKKFAAAYAEGRKHYSIKCGHSPTFVRTCQLCRRTVIRAYYAEATKRGIPAIVLGINEWAGLSGSQSGSRVKPGMTATWRVSGTRTLRPKPGSAPVQVFHLPFILQWTSADTKRILATLDWQTPKGEDFIESNSNSCLFARSTERMAKRLLEFHPDATRLAREVTVGFITRPQALKALGKIHPYPHTPRQVLEKAGIL